MNIWRFLKEKMISYDAKTALVCGNKHITYAELIETVEAAEPSYGHEIVIADDSVPLNNAIEILRIFANENIAVPLNVGYGAAYCDRIYNEIGENFDVAIDDDIALIMFTSGSSGRPKGVMLSHENIISNIAAIDKYFKITQTDSVLIARPLMHAAVLTGELFVSLFKGLTIHFYPENFMPQRIISYIKHHGISTFCTTPTLMKLLCNVIKRGETLALKNIAISGECLSHDTATLIADIFPQANIYSVYGLTEASPRVSFLPPHKYKEKSCSIGIPIDGVQMRILDDNGKAVTAGNPGRLWIKSPGLMRGYFGNEDLTKKRIKNGWLDTGDIAKYDADGYYYILGRADNLIIRSGMNVYPEEVENILLKDSRIEKALCYSEPDRQTGEKICVKLVGAITQQEAVETIKRLPVFMRPSKVAIVKDIELTNSGKVKRI